MPNDGIIVGHCSHFNGSSEPSVLVNGQNVPSTAFAQSLGSNPHAGGSSNNNYIHYHSWSIFVKKLDRVRAGSLFTFYPVRR